MTEYAFLKEVAGIQVQKNGSSIVSETKTPRIYLVFYFYKEDQTEENVTSGSELN